MPTSTSLAYNDLHTKTQHVAVERLGMRQRATHKAEESRGKVDSHHEAGRNQKNPVLLHNGINFRRHMHLRFCFKRLHGSTTPELRALTQNGQQAAQRLEDKQKNQRKESTWIQDLLSGGGASASPPTPSATLSFFPCLGAAKVFWAAAGALRAPSLAPARNACTP